MASILSFGRKAPAPAATPVGQADLAGLLAGFSIEVMPKTAEKIADFRDLLPAGTRVYVAHIDGTPFEDMLATAARLVGEGFAAMPHFPARGIADVADLERRIAAYADAGVTEALLLAGGITTPAGSLTSSMDMMETGLFDRYGFRRLHVAGHPEGNRDIDPDGGEREVMKALAWKNAFRERTDAEMAIVTQFVFEAAPVIDWANRLASAGIRLPIHVGVAGPAKLQTLIKYAMACGVGPSLRVLQRRAADLSKLVLPFTPEDVLRDLAAHRAANPETTIAAVHVFPLGGIQKAAEFVAGHLPAADAARRA
jgi:methylenetetrahydrofolate reductase (NADPH)